MEDSLLGNNEIFSSRQCQGQGPHSMAKPQDDAKQEHQQIHSKVLGLLLKGYCLPKHLVGGAKAIVLCRFASQNK